MNEEEKMPYILKEENIEEFVKKSEIDEFEEEDFGEFYPDDYVKWLIKAECLKILDLSWLFWKVYLGKMQVLLRN